MHISSVSALSAAYTGVYATGYSFAGAGSAAGTKSVVTQANGSTITTIRGSQNDIVSVTTVAPASNSAATGDAVPQSSESTVDVTA